jgi:flavodoxin
MMKALVIYYSFEGNTRFLAEQMAETTGGELLELKPLEEMKSKGFMKFIWGGKQVMSRKCPDLRPFEKNPADYDLIFIGTPVWAFTYAPALRTFFSRTELSGKKVALFCSCGGGAGKTLPRMREALAGNEILGEICFVEPLRSGTEAKGQQAREWAEQMAGLA